MKKIDIQISEILKTYTSRLDRIQVASRFHTPEYVLKSIVYRETALQDKYKPMFVELARIAHSKCVKASSDKNKLQKLLK